MYFNYTLCLFCLLFVCIITLILVIMAIVNSIIIAVYFSYYHCHCLPAFCDNKNICEVKSCKAAL